MQMCMVWNRGKDMDIVTPAHKAQAMAKAVLGTSRKKRIQPCNLGVCRESRTISYMWMIATSVIVDAKDNVRPIYDSAAVPRF